MTTHSSPNFCFSYKQEKCLRAAGVHANFLNLSCLKPNILISPSLRLCFLIGDGCPQRIEKTLGTYCLLSGSPESIIKVGLQSYSESVALCIQK